MNGRGHLRTRSFLIATSVAAAVVLSAPVVGQLRSWIRSAFPGRFVLVVGLIGAAMLAAALIASAVRIRERKWARYGAIAAAIFVAVVYSLTNASENPEATAVERFHFLEYGLITFLFYRAWRPLGDIAIVVLPALAALIVGTAEEWLQWFIPNRVGELRDIFLNLAAIVSGLLFSIGVDPPERFVATVKRESVPRILRMAAATLLAVAAFLHVVHFGYDVRDPEIGSFASRYDSAMLQDLQRARAEEWTSHPPPLVLRRFSREDQYLNEGLTHVRWRNRQWDAGNVTAAWNENRILEKYFVPVLDTPTYEGRSGHRWPAEQRRDAEERNGNSVGAPYISEAYPYPILRWRKGTFWTAVLSVAAVLIGGSLVRRPP